MDRLGVHDVPGLVRQAMRMGIGAAGIVTGNYPEMLQGNADLIPCSSDFSLTAPALETET